MGNERYRESMLRPDDEPRWRIDGDTMRASGPWLRTAGRIEVVPADLLKGAVVANERLRTQIARLGAKVCTCSGGGQAPGPEHIAGSHPHCVRRRVA